MKRYWIIIIFSMIMLVGCAITNRINHEVNFPIEPTATSISFSNTRKIETVEPGHPTQSKKKTAEAMVTNTLDNDQDRNTYNQTPVQNEREKCELNVLEFPKSNSGLEGILVLLDRSFSSTNSYLFDVSSGVETQLPNSDNPYIFDAVVSPNGEWLAYVVTSKPYQDNQLIITTSNGNVENQYALAPTRSTWPAKGHNRLLSWIDNNRLVIGYGNYPGADAISLVLNPFTGDWQSIPSNYPNLFTIVKTSPFWGKYSITLSVFHPSLDLSVYPSFEGLVLWDLRSKQAITTLPDNTFVAFHEPVWSPTANSFVIDLSSSPIDPQQYPDRNIFQVFPNGELIQLTSYSNRSARDFFHYSWAPDGNSIAFWLADRTDETRLTYNLAILDIASHQVSEFCLHPELTDINYPRSSPVWSQNSNYLAVATSSVSRNEEIQTVILNLADHTIYKLGIDGFPIGWMK